MSLELLLSIGGVVVVFDVGFCVVVVVVDAGVVVTGGLVVADSCLVIVKPIPGFGMELTGNLLPANMLANSSGFRVKSGSNNFLASSSSVSSFWSSVSSPMDTSTVFSAGGTELFGRGVEGFFFCNLLPANKPLAITSGLSASKGSNNFLSSSFDSSTADIG